MPSAWNQYVLAATKSPCLPSPHPSTSTHRPAPAQQGARGKSADPPSLSTSPSTSGGAWGLHSNPASCPSLQARQLGSLILDISGLPGDLTLLSLPCLQLLPCWQSSWHDTIENWSNKETSEWALAGSQLWSCMQRKQGSFLPLWLFLGMGMGATVDLGAGQQGSKGGQL